MSSLLRSLEQSDKAAGLENGDVVHGTSGAMTKSGAEETSCLFMPYHCIHDQPIKIVYSIIEHLSSHCVPLCLPVRRVFQREAVA